MLLIDKEKGPLLAKFILAVGLERFRELVGEL